jgi:hypothetical protein
MKELSTDAYAVMIVAGILLLMMFGVMGEKNAIIAQFNEAGCELLTEE